ncbi:MAG: acyl-CoA dehydrogenase [Deltaproteobacteria bacterium]|nr:acyl-CoA dehydrogenase [Deltaproteobacteria bacterium]MBW1876178.1 acyl-CoA dehydrogenase [Deltaproteobacteria bacterium]MBW2214974.1 acyl-CoA dehydrogenase [Deltaproteobacteria bacterium]MBW2380887.1 acyl-CoA dehydrogenase [Deltaproteobacteria bacterium]MBW2627201.1 acyl-CoA dehydrogenase [Deltaproteobacteria bacterium]
MVLLNPKKHSRLYPDERSREVMLKTIDFFERKGKRRVRDDYHAKVWYADFLDFVKEEKIFATMCTPAGNGAPDSRWDTWRICEFAEILGFYGLQYWYTWQVTVLGLGPIWMSENEPIKERAAKALEQGGIFAFGLSEKEHGADVYSTDMILTPQGDGTYTAKGGKYYIGNGNKAAIVSTFGKLADSDEYVFFGADSQHDRYHLIKNVCASQNYVAQFELEDYPVSEADIIAKGEHAWNSALNTVNIGKYNLGWASIGMCTHALYEAIHHASNRRLYNMYVTDFPHVKQMFTDAYARLIAMKLFALRAADYMRVASPEDRRYLLYNPMVKMKVTTQGEDVMNLLWDVIAAKGFEEDMMFEQAAVDIRALPKLEGTVHVNIALIVKFMANYFFAPADYSEVAQQNQAANDDFLFDQGPTKGLRKIRFHDYNIAYSSRDTANLGVFREQIAAFKEMLMTAPPDDAQQKDIDFLLAGGEIFALVAYGQLILENAKIYDVSDDVVDQIFDFMVRDFSRHALSLYSKPTSSETQMASCLQMIRKPVLDEARYQRVWQQVHDLQDEYEMAP